jgi:hypothetical protein
MSDIIFNHLSKFCLMNEFGATTFSITTLSLMGLFATLSINDIQHNAFSVIMLSAQISLMLC